MHKDFSLIVRQLKLNISGACVCHYCTIQNTRMKTQKLWQKFYLSTLPVPDDNTALLTQWSIADTTL